MHFPQISYKSLSVLAVAGFLNGQASAAASVPAIVERAAIGTSAANLYEAIKEYLAPDNAYVCPPNDLRNLSADMKLV